MTERIAAIAGLVVVLAAAAIVAGAVWPERAGNGSPTPTDGRRSGPAARPSIGTMVAPDPVRFALQPVKGRPPVQYRFKHPPAAGVLFDLRTGRILWQRRPRLEHPIASLTKMMTALIVAQGNSPKERVKVSAKAARTPGSATGLLPRGRKVPLGPLLQALVMISANDAAVALAEHDGKTATRFVKEMNRQAHAMQLSCTHFSTPNGLRDRNNYSCPVDLAELARADLANPRIARIAQTRYAKPRFPIKGKRLYLTNNHYFLQHGLAGLPQAQVTGLKTGFTDAAGSCYVTTARIGHRELGVIVLDSPSPLTQVPALLRAGFVQEGVAPPLPPAPAGKRQPVD